MNLVPSPRSPRRGTARKALRHRAQSLPRRPDVEGVRRTLPSAQRLYERVLDTELRRCRCRPDTKAVSSVLAWVQPRRAQRQSHCGHKSLPCEATAISKREEWAWPSSSADHI